MVVSVVAGLCISGLLIAAWDGYVSWWVTLGVTAAILVVGMIAHPYFAGYRWKSQGPVCGGCGYELRGCTGEACPECGEAIDVPVGGASCEDRLRDDT